ncbi:MAG: hypothetical protein D6767_03980, partial [Candidatus Hydrogenedentota bacterium]
MRPVKNFLKLVSLFLFSTSIFAGVPYTVNYTGISGSPIVRGSTTTVNYTFEVYDDGNNLYTGSISSNWVVKVYDSSNNDVTTDFATSISYPGSSGTVTVQPKPSAAVATGFYISITRTDDGTFYINEEASTVDLGNPGGTFEVQNASLHIKYSSLSPTSIAQQDGNKVTYQFKIYYPDESYQYATNGSSLTVKVWDGATDVSSNFTIATPYVDLSGVWNVDISANYNA